MNRINKKIIVLIGIILAITTVIHSAFIFTIYNRLTSSSVFKNKFLMETIIRNDNRYFADEIFDRREESLKLHIQKLMEIEGMNDVDVIDTEFNSLVSERKYTRQEAADEEGKPVYSIRKNSGMDVLIAFFPVKILDEVFGYVRIEYSLREFETAKRDIIFITLAIMLIFSTSLAWLVYTYLTKNVTAPINNLTENIHRIVTEDSWSSGKKVEISDETGEALRKKLQDSSLNEVEILEASFNIMVNRINEYSAQMEEKIKTLKGMLPICSNCKKIRDDNGYWHMVEVYIKKYTDADFTHGICPDCVKKLYPDFKKDEHTGE